MSEQKESSKKSWLKSWFRSQTTPISVEDVAPSTEFNEGLWQSLKAANPAEIRISKLNQLCNILENTKMERTVVEKLWIETKDLLSPHFSRTITTSYFNFLIKLIRSQYRQLGMMTPMLYQELKDLSYSHQEDILNVMLIINYLTDHGKNLCMMEHEIGLHLVKWMDHLGGNDVYLNLLLNIIKYNSSHLSKETIQGIVRHLCEHCSITASTVEMESLLKVLDAIICYNSLPHQCLYDVIVTLCRTLNLKEFCEQSWKLMRNLLGTRLGHSCIEIMCGILQDKSNKEYSMLRSTVSFIGIGLWGSKCVPALMHKPQSILPSFKRALAHENPMLAFEISLTCQRLVKKFGHELHASAWDEILEIIVLLLNIVDTNPDNEQLVSLKQNAHELLTIIEKLYQSQAFNGSTDELFCIVEEHMKSRPFDSLLLLISYRSQAINPAKGNWISILLDFINKYYVASNNTKSKLKVLDIVENVIITNIEVYEKEIIDNVILPTFEKIVDEECYVVQENVIRFLLKLCNHSRTNRCIALQHIMSEHVQITSNFNRNNEKLVSCVECVLDGLTNLFTDKLYTEYSSHAVEAAHLMVTFIEDYYQHSELGKYPTVFKVIRQKMLSLFLELRVNMKLEITLKSKAKLESDIVCLPYEEAENRDCSDSFNMRSKPSHDHVLAYQRIFSCFAQCLTNEKYWPILESVIEGASHLLDNRPLILATNPKEIDALAEALTGLISNTNRVLTLVGAPSTFKRHDLMNCALRAILVLPSYHDHMTTTRQRQILRCLEAGFNSKCAKQCIAATTLCMIEMKSEALLRNLPNMLLRLSQMSATVVLATSVLELLSTLAQLPQLYSNFVDDQYMGVFKIALQHADPDKFNLYVVSLAHHVITMWFIKCRLAFRPDFVRYITLSLQNTLNSSRDNSLQHNLIESCIDVMARYTFADRVPPLSYKQRSLSKSGRRATWLLGNRLVTIQTDISLDRSVGEVPCDDVEQISTEALHPTDTLLTGAEKKISFEAPAKLPSSDSIPVTNTRQRHKSSGALLRKNTDELCNTRSSCARSRVWCSDDAGSGWAEIFIRRPSGNTSWLLSSHQLSLVLNDNLQSSPGVPHEAHNLSHSTTDLSTDGESLGDHREEVVLSRQRSRTVSSSQDYVVDAANRAKTKAKEHCLKSYESQSTKRAALTRSIERRQILSPEFIFLQLFHSAIVADGLHRPFLLPDSATVERSVNVLDLIPPYDTWQTGVVYVRPGQSDDGKAILYNRHGSVRYQDLLSSLGTLVSLADCDPSCTHLGGLDHADGEDGEMTYVWQESVMQMVFHVATLMPNHESGVSNKQRHIGNDYVTIVYDDNEPPSYVPGSVVKGQFLSVEIIISPIDLDYNIVRLVYHKPELKNILQMEEKYTVSDGKLTLLVRQLALHASMASAAHHLKTPEKFVSRSLSRLKQIKHIRTRALQELKWKNEERSKRYPSPPDLYLLEDFTDFVS